MNSKLIVGDCRKVLASLPDESVDCCVTSPPYFGLRDYGKDGQIGLEQTPEAYVQELVGVFREVRRVLRDDGTLWLNLGDTYARSAGPEESKLQTLHTMGVGQKKAHEMGAMRKGKNHPPKGFKPKDLIGIPWRVAFALQADGWYLRQDIIWSKPNPMPESVTDRCTKAHEYIFLLSKSQRYHYDAEAIAEPVANPDGFRYEGGYRDMMQHNEKEGRMMAGGGTAQHSRTETGSVPHFASGFGDKRNKRSVWTVTTKPCREAHFATFPPDLILPCVLAGCRPDGTVLDPFNGAGTTGLVSLSNGRRYVGIELNPEYADISMRRLGLMATMVHRKTYEEGMTQSSGA
jgi:DNA modification methylase